MHIYQKIAKILAAIIVVVGTMVMIGWFIGIPALTSILPQWVTMKFSTALSFALSGVILYIVSSLENERSTLAESVLLICSLAISTLMVVLLISIVLGFRSGIENLFVRETEGAVKTTTPGRPSVGTMVNFIVIATIGILGIINSEKYKKQLLIVGWLVGVIGVAAVVGYIINLPLLYYTVEGVSTAMAFHTALLFTLLGAGMVILGKVKPGNLTQ
jgi:hypothetical protein